MMNKAIGGLLSAFIFTAVAAAAPVPKGSDAFSKSRLQASYGKIPLSFEENRGQTDARVKFLSRGQGYTLFLTSSEAVLTLKEAIGNGQQATGPEPKSKIEDPKSAVLRMKLVGANPEPKIAGMEELPGKSNYFIGNDPSKWRTNLPNYTKVSYENVYPGIDLFYYGNQGQLEYDLIVAPGTDPGAIKLAFEGADKIDVGAQGELVLHAGGGQIELKKPVVYQVVDGVRKEISADYVLLEPQNSAPKIQPLGFQLAAFDSSKPLIIDPVLVYSTYLGGTSDDPGFGIAVDSTGNAYVIGLTLSTDFPTANPLQPASLGGSNAFVVKFNPTGSALIYSTYLGGSSGDIGFGIAVDSAGNAYVTGETYSSNFPTVNPLQPTSGGYADAFVAKLNPDGSALVYSTYLGGAGDADRGFGIAVDSGGNAYVTGRTDSTNFPTANALQPVKPNAGDTLTSFVAKLDPTGTTLIYSTYLGGSQGVLSGSTCHPGSGQGIAADADGNAYVTGRTNCADFPTSPNAVQPTLAGKNGWHNAFVAKLNPSGSALVYSTYLGGSTGDQGSGIVVDADGNAYVTGITSSADFPTTVNALQPFFGGGNQDAFVAKLNPTGSALAYSTYLGGSGWDGGNGIDIDTQGNAYVAGETGSVDFPISNPFQVVPRGGDAFVAKLNPTGSALVYSTYLGGSSSEIGRGIAVDSSGAAYVTGHTNSKDFPTKNPLQPTLRGNFQDLFVAKIVDGPSDVAIENVVWTNMVNATATGNSIQKTSGCDGCDDAGAISLQKITSGDGYVEFSISEADTLRYVGLSNGSVGTGADEIDFAIAIGWGWAEVRENGVFRANTQTVAGDLFRIVAEAGMVKYYKNGAPVYFSAVAPAYPLVLDTSLFHLGATVNNAVIAGSLDSSGGSGPDTTAPVISSVASSSVGSTNATITWTTNEPADSQVEYGTTTAYGNLTPLDTTLVTSHAQGLTGLSSGTLYHYRVRSRDAAGNLAVSGDFTFTTASSGDGTTVENVIWTDIVNATATGNSLTKTSGCDGCDDAGAISQQQITGDGYVEFTVSETELLRYVGLSNGGATTDYAEIDFAIAIGFGWLEVRENGVYRANAAVATGDVLRVAVESGVVNYYKNGSLLYTSAAAPVLPLVVDSSLFSLNATVSNAVIAY